MDGQSSQSVSGAWLLHVLIARAPGSSAFTVPLFYFHFYHLSYFLFLLLSSILDMIDCVLFLSNL